jgi:hypothetical protein
MPFDRARPDEQLRVDDDPVGCEIFGSVVASIGLTMPTTPGARARFAPTLHDHTAMRFDRQPELQGRS